MVMKIFQSIVLTLSLIFLIGLTQILRAVQTDTTGLELKSKDNTQRIKALLKLSDYCYHILGNERMADSVAYQAIIEAKVTANQSLLLSAYRNYALVGKVSTLNDRSVLFIREALEIARQSNKEQFIETQFDYITLLIRGHFYEQAREVLSEIDADELKDAALKIKCLMLSGDLADKGKSLSDRKLALSSLLNAQYLARREKYDQLLIESLSKLSIFYRHNDNYLKALEYNDAVRNLLDSLQRSPYEKLINLSDRLDIFIAGNETDAAMSLQKEILAQTRTLGYKTISESVLSGLRTLLMNQGRIKEICAIYCDPQNQGELENLKLVSLNRYYRLKSMLAEGDNDIDSAIYYLQVAEVTMDTINIDYRANFFLRKGEFYLRQKYIPEAIGCFEKACLFAQKAKNFNLIITTSRYIDSLFGSQNQLQSAYPYCRLNRIYTDSLKELKRNDELIFIELEGQNKLNELRAAHEHEQQNKEHNIELLLIFVMIIFAFIALIVLSNTPLPRWVISTFGYLLFIAFFETMIFLIDTYLHHETNGSPILTVSAKIVLIAFLMPLHHWLEHKSVHYLLKRELISDSKNLFRNIWTKISDKEINSGKH